MFPTKHKTRRWPLTRRLDLEDRRRRDIWKDIKAETFRDAFFSFSMVVSFMTRATHPWPRASRWPRRPRLLFLLRPGSRRGRSRRWRRGRSSARRRGRRRGKRRRRTRREVKRKKRRTETYRSMPKKSVFFPNDIYDILCLGPWQNQVRVARFMIRNRMIRFEPIAIIQIDTNKKVGFESFFILVFLDNF